MTTPQYRIGVDLGGTKMEARVLAADGSEPVAPIRRDTPREDYARTVTGIRDLVTEAAQSVGAASLPVAVAIPGGICPVEDVVKNANATRLNGQPLHRDLEAAFGRPVRVENDANCFVMSEARDGAAAGAKTVFGVILGTGVGGGIVINGEVLSGANRIAGEWGHIPIPPHCGPDGRLCYCGARDCVEKHVSGPALEAAYFREAEKAARATEIAGLAGTDAVARRVYHQWLSTLASSMATIINVIDPDVVVLGGGVSNIPDLPDLLMIRLPHEAYGTSGAPPRTQVLRNRHGDSSGARGAAWLAA